MGKEFLRAKNEGFQRGRDETTKRMLQGDLFSTCRPSTRSYVMGLATGGRALEPGSELFAADARPTALYSGGEPVLKLLGAADLCGPVIGRVVDVDDTGVHRVEIGTLGGEES